MPLTRRDFLRQSLVVALTSAATSPTITAQPRPIMPLPLACNTYPWFTFDQRDGRDFHADLDAAATAVAAVGIESLEPNLESIDLVDAYATALDARGVRMESIYVNSVLHEREAIEASIDEVLRIAARAQHVAGTRIVVTNPRPITWGGPENKTDDEIRRQGEALNRLGQRLAAEGLILAYHNHDSELRLGAREFHHMLAATDPAAVKFCFDAHWIYRGCGDSNLAVIDAIRLYGDRVVEVHLRQSTGGIWDEVFQPVSDLDYPAILAALRERGANPLLVLEQAVEAGSPHTLDARAAHAASVAQLRQMMT